MCSYGEEPPPSVFLWGRWWQNPGWSRGGWDPLQCAYYTYYYAICNVLQYNIGWYRIELPVYVAKVLWQNLGWDLLQCVTYVYNVHYTCNAMLWYYCYNILLLQFNLVAIYFNAIPCMIGLPLQEEAKPWVESRGVGSAPTYCHCTRSLLIIAICHLLQYIATSAISDMTWFLPCSSARRGVKPVAMFCLCRNKTHVGWIEPQEGWWGMLQ